MAHFLVVDDSKFQRKGMCHLLVNEGHEVTEAGDGLQALEMLNSSRFDFIFCDLLMPKADGFAVLEGMKSSENSTPIYIITADIQTTSLERCNDLGAYGFINKPVSGDRFKEIIRDIVSVNKLTEENSFKPSEEQLQAFLRMVNIGIRRGACLLSELVSQPVELQAPSIEIVDQEDLLKLSDSASTEPISVVQQSFEGNISGTAILVFSSPVALRLVSLLLNGEVDEEDLDAECESTISEIGNILINAVLGTVGNIVQTTIDFHIPHYAETTTEELYIKWSSAAGEMYFVDVSFGVANKEIIGNIILIIDNKTSQAIFERV